MPGATGRAASSGKTGRDTLRVLMVTAWPPANEAGGVGTVIRTLSTALGPAHQVTILIDDWEARHLRRTTEGGLACYRLRLRSPYHRQRPLLNLLGWLRDLPLTLLELKRLMRTESIDIVHAHFASAYQFYFRIIQALGGPPYIVTLHRGDTVNFPQRSRIERALTLWTLRGARRVIAVSDWLRDLGRRTFGGVRGVETIRNGLNLSEIDRLVSRGESEPPAIELPAQFFLMVANVTFYKAPDVAIRAWAELRSRRPDIHLVIAGERRELWDSCKELIQALGCADRVHMVGALSRRAVIGLMRRATALVFPSRSEGLPMVLLEAGAVGLATICSRIGPFVEVVEDQESALVVPPEDPTALADAVARLAGDPDLRRRLGAALGQRVRRDFSAERMAQDYAKVYRRALGRDPDDDPAGGRARP